MYSLFVTTPNTQLNAVERRVRAIFGRRRQHVGASPNRELTVLTGFETRTEPREYRWDGLRRGGDPRHPFVVIQYTLSGFGHYHDERGTVRVQPGQCFFAVVPSAHRYYLPPESRAWRFFWLIAHHPYVVRRIQERQQTARAVLTIPPDALLTGRLLALLEGTCQQTFPDAFAVEQALFDLLIEYERFVHQLYHPRPRAQALLQSVRSAVLEQLTQPISVDALAAAQGMSRSHFSHHFRRVTGVTPAHYVTRLRIEEVQRRLLQSGAKLATVARETGFADANHLCKVFRRYLHVSPGEFRRQMG